MKYPWLQFFAGDWLKDPALSICSPATRGVWIDLLCAMHELDRAGELRGTREQLARVARCLPVEIDNALTELQATGAADVTERNSVVTLINRRMQRESKARKDGALRVARYRRNAPCNENITPYKSEVISQKSEREGKEPPPMLDAGAEIPTAEQALALTANAGILPDFVRYVFEDWSTRNGKDGAGNVVSWLPYVTKRWAREQVEWKAGTHRGRKATAAKPARAEGVPTRTEVLAYAREKWGDDKRHTNWAVSFCSHWSDAKRDWKRNGRVIDWKVELSAQVGKWRTQQ